jgi:hypothetical protein
MDSDDSNLNCTGTGLQTRLPLALYDSAACGPQEADIKNRKHMFNFGEDWRRSLPGLILRVTSSLGAVPMSLPQGSGQVI